MFIPLPLQSIVVSKRLLSLEISPQHTNSIAFSGGRSGKSMQSHNLCEGFWVAEELILCCIEYEASALVTAHPSEQRRKGNRSR